MKGRAGGQGEMLGTGHRQVTYPEAFPGNALSLRLWDTGSGRHMGGTDPKLRALSARLRARGMKSVHGEFLHFKYL